MPNVPFDVSEHATLVGLGDQPTGVTAKRVTLYDSTGATMPWPSALGTGTVSDSLPVNIAVDQSPIPAVQYVWNGTGYERVRTPNTFKIVSAVSITAGTGLTVMTVDQNMRFRMLGYKLSHAGASRLIFGYGATATVTTVLFQGPLLAAAGIDDTPYLMNGVVWPAGQNVNLDVSTTGAVTGTVWGCYEVSPSGGPA